MATKTIVCPECESPLAPGRFSCPACGALVASVASSSRAFVVPDEPRPAEVLHVDAPPADAGEPAVGVGWDAVREMEDVPGSNGHAAAEVFDDLPLASAAASEVFDDLPLASAAVPEVDAAAVDASTDDEPVTEPGAFGGAGAAAAVGEPAWPDHPTWPLPTVDPRTPPAVLGAVGGPADAPVDEVADEPPAAAVAQGLPFPSAVSPATPDTAIRVPAGVYLPPSAVLPPGEALPLPGSPVAEAPATVAPAPTGRRWPSLDALAVPDDAGARTIAIGGGIAILGFLLPWADIVIGSGRLDGSLLSTWGLAGPAAPFALLLVLMLTAFAVFRGHLPAWIGLSTPSIALGALLAGITWPYLFGTFNAAIGVYVVAVGAFVLVAGGLVDRVMPRHGEPPAGV